MTKLILSILLIPIVHIGMSKYQFLLKNPSATPSGISSNIYTIIDRKDTAIIYFTNDTVSKVTKNKK